jgi:hypothetical protein
VCSFLRASLRIAFEPLQCLDQSLVRGSILYDHLSLAIDRQQLGTTRPPESLKVGLRISAKICQRSNVLWSDHGCYLSPVIQLRITCELTYVRSVRDRFLAGYSISAKMKYFTSISKRPYQNCSYTLNFLLSVYDYCHQIALLHRLSMAVAQCLGGEFAEEEAIISGQTPELPNAELGGNFGDCCHGGISG